METGLISKEQEIEIAELRAEIESGFRNLQIFRSEFLMRNSVLAMQATNDGKYWQAILERNVHFWELMRLGYDYKEKIADIDIKKAMLAKKQHDVKKAKDRLIKAILEAEASKLGIEIEKENTFLIHMKKEAEQRVREVKTWTKIIAELKPQLKYSPDNPEECQAEEWAKNYAARIDAIKMVGATDMNGAINTLIVANAISKDPKVMEIVEKEKRAKEV